LALFFGCKDCDIELKGLVMWEEDPRWQQAQYKILVWSVGVSGPFALFVSALTGDWSVARWYFTAVGVVVAALCVYAAVVWMVGHAAMLLIKFFKRVFHGDQKD